MRGLIRRGLLGIALGAASAAGFAGASSGEDGHGNAVPADQASIMRLTLDEARERAVAHNKSLGLARLNVDEKGHATEAARKDYFPKFLGNVTHFHFDKPLGSVLTAGGGPVGLPPVARNVNVLNQDTTLSTVFMAQPITKLIAVNALVQIARADENIARAKLDKGTQDVVTGVTQVYFGLVGARRIQAALELQARALEQLGGAQPSPEVRINLVEVRQGLVQVKGQANELSNQLNDLLDLPACAIVELVDPVPPPPPIQCADEAVRLALVSNGEVREAEQNITKAEAGLRVAKMDYLPDVAVIGGYANQTAANYVQDNIGYVGVFGTYTFWDWGKRKNVKWQRQSQIALAYQNLQVVRDKVQLEARKTYGAFEQALASYRLSGEMVQARKDAEKSAPDAGAAATAKGETAKAELDYLKAEIAYRIAYAQLMGAISQP